ncbi:MAG: acyl-CoA dehydratase activase [Syntrophales bacterium]|nr:acyl-CoA dehydratase activase [Syntrophales bacterium]
MIGAGIDIGSVAIKAVLYEENSVLEKLVLRGSSIAQDAVCTTLDTCLEKAGRVMADVGWVVYTGIPIKPLPVPGENKSLLSCLAMGIREIAPSVRTLIDVGAENVTVISFAKEGFIVDYAFNDNCAAGAGIYLEAMAKLTGNDLTEMIDKASRAKCSAPINSVCTVFAEQEVISSAFSDPPVPIESILLGIHESLAMRISGLVHRVGIKEEVCICGGVARNTVFVDALAQRLKTKIQVVNEPEVVAAFGAALLSSNYLKRKVQAQ